MPATEASGDAPRRWPVPLPAGPSLRAGSPPKRVLFLNPGSRDGGNPLTSPRDAGHFTGGGCKLPRRQERLKRQTESPVLKSHPKPVGNPAKSSHSRKRPSRKPLVAVPPLVAAEGESLLLPVWRWLGGHFLLLAMYALFLLSAGRYALNALKYAGVEDWPSTKATGVRETGTFRRFPYSTNHGGGSLGDGSAGGAF